MPGFSGQSVSLGYYYQVYVPSVPTLGRIAYGTATVGPGVEFPNTANLLTYLPPGTVPAGSSIDIGTNSITVTRPISEEGMTLAPGTFYTVLTLLDPYAPRISGVELLATNAPVSAAGSGIVGVSSFDANHIVAGGTIPAGVTLPKDQPVFATIGVQFEHHVNVHTNVNGTHAIYGYDDDQQLYSRGNDTMTGGGVHESFVFKPHFGQDLITDFILGGSEHDVLKLSSSEFSDVGQMLQRTHPNSSGEAVIYATPSDTITLAGVSKADLAQHAQDIMFHP